MKFPQWGNIQRSIFFALLPNRDVWKCMPNISCDCVCTLKAVFELLTSVFGIRPTEYNLVNSDNVLNIILICNMFTVFILI